MLTLPEQFGVGADYGLALPAGPPEQQAARHTSPCSSSPEGQAILARWGFLPIAAGDE